MKNRKARIMESLATARSLLLTCAAVDPGSLTHAFCLMDAQAFIRRARALMDEAPASTRRRWKHGATINARKRARRAFEAGRLSPAEVRAYEYAQSFGQ